MELIVAPAPGRPDEEESESAGAQARVKSAEQKNSGQWKRPAEVRAKASSSPSRS